MLWSGAADSRASPLMTLNYYDQVRRTLGEDATPSQTRWYVGNIRLSSQPQWPTQQPDRTRAPLPR